MNRLKFFLIVFIVLFSFPVYAAEFNMNSLTSASLGGTTNRYRGVEIVQTGMPGTFTFGTRYTGKLSTIETYFNYPFEANTTYILTYNMNTEDFRNNFSAQYWWDCDDEMNATNQHVGSLSYISYKKVKFSFKPSENTTCIRVLIGSANQSSQAITGISNWRLDSITLYDPAYQSGSGSGQGSTATPTPSPTGATNQDIINNQNNNTQDIINNQNSNTQDIIENNNQNTKEITESIKDTFNNCSQIDTNITNADADPNLINKLITSDGSIANSVAGQYSVSKYIEIFPNSYYSLTTTNSSPNSVYFCWYTASKVQLHCTKYNQQSEWYFHTGDDAKYIRFTLKQDDDSYTLHLLSDEVCKNKLDSLNESIDSLNDTMKDETAPTIDLDLTMTPDTPISGLLTMPLTILNRVLDLSDDICQPYVLPFDFSGGNNTITFPCIDLEDYLGHDVYVILDTILCFYICYQIGMMCVSIYDDITSLRDGFGDMYQPKHRSARVARGEMEGRY